MKPEDIRKIVHAHFPEMQLCYEAALKRSSKVEGKVSIAFEIDPAGEVFFARISQGILADAEAQKCVLAVFRGLHFPPAPGGRETVVYPIMFAPGGD
jgi:TonB family protein